MVCPKCGQANPAVAQFCGKCGGPLAPAGTQSTSTTGVSSETKIILIIASVIIPLIGIIMGIVYMNSSDAGKKSLGKTLLLIGIGVSLFYCALSGAFNNMMQSY